MIQSIEIEGKPFEIEIPDDVTPEEVDQIVNAEMGQEGAPPEQKDQYGRTLINGIAQVSKDDPLAAGNELKTFGAIAKAPIKAGADIVKSIPASLKAQFKDFGGYYKGVGKGIAQSALDLTVNPILGIRNIGAVNPVDNAIRVPEAKSEEEKIGMKFGSAGTNIAAAFLPVKNVGATGAKSAIAEGAENFATRSQNRLVKINSPEWNAGARPEINAKYGVIGQKAEDAIAQWESLKQPIFEALDKKIAGQLDNPENITSVDEIKNQAIATVKNSKLSDLEKVKQINGIEKYFADPDFKTAYPNDNLNIVQANRLKIDTGRNGAWYSKGNGARVDPDAPLKAQVANAIYDGLKKTVENKGSPGIKELNKALSEIIPMQLAAEKRLMVDKRSNFASLDDVIGAIGALAAAGQGNLAPALFAGGNMAVKSPLAGKAAFKLSQTLKGQSVPRGVKEIQDAIAMGDAPTPSSTAPAPKSSGIPEMLKKQLYKDVNTLNEGMYAEDAPTFLSGGPPAYGRPITEMVEDLETGKITPWRRLTAAQQAELTGKLSPMQKSLPPPMIPAPGQKLNIQPPLPTMGDRIRSIGTNPPAPTGANQLPSPEVIKQLYPHLSDEDIKGMVAYLNERRMLPAPMISTTGEESFQRMLPTLRQRLESIGGKSAGKKTEYPYYKEISRVKKGKK